MCLSRVTPRWVAPFHPCPLWGDDARVGKGCLEYTQIFPALLRRQRLPPCLHRCLQPLPSVQPAAGTEQRRCEGAAAPNETASVGSPVRRAAHQDLYNCFCLPPPPPLPGVCINFIYMLDGLNCFIPVAKHLLRHLQPQRAPGCLSSASSCPARWQWWERCPRGQSTRESPLGTRGPVPPTASRRSARTSSHPRPTSVRKPRCKRGCDGFP